MARLATLLATLLLPRCASFRDGTGCVNDCGAFATPPHGTCVTSSFGAASCVCTTSYRGVGCAERACPTALAWFDAPASATIAHTTLLQCAGVGRCDAVTGACACSPGYEGAACERTACPGASASGGLPCSGHGRCVTLREAGVARAGGVDYAAWDADRVQGCACDEGWGGPDCASRTCPTGSSPLPHVLPDGSIAGVEVQAVATVIGGSPPAITAMQLETQRLVFSATASSTGTLPSLGSGGSADIDAVQHVQFAGSGAPPWGNFSLTLDARRVGYAGGACSTWDDSQRVLATTRPITLRQSEGGPLAGSQSAADEAALDMAAALGELPSIGGADQVVVTGHYRDANPTLYTVPLPGAVIDDDGTYGLFTYTFSVTFVGARVGGDVGLLSFADPWASNMNPPTWLLWRGVNNITTGSQLAGDVVVSYDDTPAWTVAAEMLGALAGCGDEGDADGSTLRAWVNSGPVGPATAVLTLGESTVALRNRLTELLFACPPGALGHDEWGVDVAAAAGCVEAPPVGALTVTRVPTGGPGFALDIVFAQGVHVRGNLAQLTLLPASVNTTAALVHPQSLGGEVTFVATSEELVTGFTFGGQWSLGLPYPTPDVTAPWLYADAVGPFPWCVEASVIQAALQDAEDSFGLGLGLMQVSRTRTYLPGASVFAGWVGSYEWRVSFLSLSDADGAQLPPLVLPDVGSLSLRGALDDAATISVARVAAGGGPLSATNEVQVIDCACVDPDDADASALDLCVDPMTQGFALEWQGSQTAFIPYIASSEDVRLALASLPSIPDVSVRFYSRASGSTTSTTLCDFHGVSAAITFTHNPGTALPPLTIVGSTLPSATLLTVRTAPSLGTWGGRARRGTRALLPCSGAGTCSPITGLCTCLGGNALLAPLFGGSDGAGGDLGARVASPGYGNSLPYAPTLPQSVTAKVRSNCGRLLAAEMPAGCVHACGGALAGRGVCSGPPLNVCICARAWTGVDCSIPVCPVSTVSLFSTPLRNAAGAVVAHAPQECGGMGVCSDGRGGVQSQSHVQSGRTQAAPAGTCACVNGWSGAACDVSPCPTRGAQTTAGIASCASGAPCVSMRTLSAGWELSGPSAGTRLPSGVSPAFIYGSVDGSGVVAAWDADLLRGCVCSGGPPALYAHQGAFAHNWAFGTGFDCTLRPCPGGPDPQAVRAALALGDAGTDSEDSAAPPRGGVQYLSCSLVAGSVTLTYRGSTTTPLFIVGALGGAGTPVRGGAYVLDADVPPEEWSLGGRSLETALRSLPSLGGGAFTLDLLQRDSVATRIADARSVHPLGTTGVATGETPVPAPRLTRLCDALGRVVVRVTILVRPPGGGLLPLLLPTLDSHAIAGGGALSVEYGDGVGGVDPSPPWLEWHECNNRGTCDRTRGVCVCERQFQSSDGAGGRGQLGDCGAENVAAGLPTRGVHSRAAAAANRGAGSWKR